MADPLGDMELQINGFLEAANDRQVGVNPEVGAQMVAVLDEMAIEIDAILNNIDDLARKPKLGGHPESLIMAERQAMVASGGPQSLDVCLQRIRGSVLTAKHAVEASMRTIIETDEDAAGGLGRQYE